MILPMLLVCTFQATAGLKIYHIRHAQAGHPEYQKVKAELKAAMMKITQKKLDLSKKEVVE